MTANPAKDRSSESELIRQDSLWVRVADAVKEAFFPTRCLTCGSFYRVDKPRRKSLKLLLQPLRLRNRSDFVLDTFFKVSAFYSDGVENGLSPEARIFAMLMGPFLCAECSGKFLTIESPICSACGIVFKSRAGEDHLCGECIKTPKRFGMGRSAGVYDKVLMAVIHCLKYNGKIQLARPLGVLLFFIFCRYWNENFPDLIVPVPLHNKKLRHRGFNPSFVLIKEWDSIARQLDRGFPAVPLAMDILVRKKWTKSQAGLGRKERLKNIKHAFSVEDPSTIRRKKILLVDDVYTTGATADECSKVLLKAGAARVDVLTLARAI